MGETANQIASDKWEFYFSSILSPTVKGWLNDELTPASKDDRAKKLAVASVKSAMSKPPTKGDVVIDNSSGKALLWSGLIAAFLGIGMISTEPVLLGVVLVFLSFFLFFTASSSWVTAEKAEKLAEEKFRADTKYWEQVRDEYVSEVLELWKLRLHLTIAKQLGVPQRLHKEFARISIQNEKLYKYQWDEELEMWSSQPEFPEAPGAIPGGISHKEYESYCERVLHSWGFLDAATTRFSRDGGIDVESTEIVAQCKHYVGSVGVREVREIFGIASHKSKIAVVFSAGSYTADATQFAKEAGVALFILNEMHGQAKALTPKAHFVADHKFNRD